MFPESYAVTTFTVSSGNSKTAPSILPALVVAASRLQGHVSVALAERQHVIVVVCDEDNRSAVVAMATGLGLQEGSVAHIGMTEVGDVPA